MEERVIFPDVRLGVQLGPRKCGLPSKQWGVHLLLPVHVVLSCWFAAFIGG